MINLKKKNTLFTKLLANDHLSTKVSIYPSTKSVGEDYDPYEQRYTYTSLNPLTIKGYVTEIKPEALVWKQYGLQEVGAKEILCEDKYAEWFRIANRIVIDGDDYSLYKEGLGNKALITKRPFKMLRVVVFKT